MNSLIQFLPFQTCSSFLFKIAKCNFKDFGKKLLQTPLDQVENLTQFLKYLLNYIPAESSMLEKLDNGLLFFYIKKLFMQFRKVIIKSNLDLDMFEFFSCPTKETNLKNQNFGKSIDFKAQRFYRRTNNPEHFEILKKPEFGKKRIMFLKYLKGLSKLINLMVQIQKTKFKKCLIAKEEINLVYETLLDFSFQIFNFAKKKLIGQMNSILEQEILTSIREILEFEHFKLRIDFKISYLNFFGVIFNELTNWTNFEVNNCSFSDCKIIKYKFENQIRFFKYNIENLLFCNLRGNIKLFCPNFSNFEIKNDIFSFFFQSKLCNIFMKRFKNRHFQLSFYIYSIKMEIDLIAFSHCNNLIIFKDKTKLLNIIHLILSKITHSIIKCKPDLNKTNKIKLDELKILNKKIKEIVKSSMENNKIILPSLNELHNREIRKSIYTKEFYSILTLHKKSDSLKNLQKILDFDKIKKEYLLKHGNERLWIGKIFEPLIQRMCLGNYVSIFIFKEYSLFFNDFLNSDNFVTISSLLSGLILSQFFESVLETSNLSLCDNQTFSFKLNKYAEFFFKLPQNLKKMDVDQILSESFFLNIKKERYNLTDWNSFKYLFMNTFLLEINRNNFLQFLLFLKNYFILLILMILNLTAFQLRSILPVFQISIFAGVVILNFLILCLTSMALIKIKCKNKKIIFYCFFKNNSYLMIISGLILVDILIGIHFCSAICLSIPFMKSFEIYKFWVYLKKIIMGFFFLLLFMLSKALFLYWNGGQKIQVNLKE